METALLTELSIEELRIVTALDCAVSEFIAKPCTAESRTSMYQWYNKIGELNTSFFLNEFFLLYLSRTLTKKMTLKHRSQIASLLRQVTYNLTINKLWRSIGQESQAAD